MATNPHLVDDEDRRKWRMLFVYINRDSFSMQYVEIGTTGVVNKHEHTLLFAMDAWFNRPKHRGIKLT
jgi:hypothetical protein